MPCRVAVQALLEKKKKAQYLPFFLLGTASTILIAHHRQTISSEAHVRTIHATYHWTALHHHAFSVQAISYY